MIYLESGARGGEGSAGKWWATSSCGRISWTMETWWSRNVYSIRRKEKKDAATALLLPKKSHPTRDRGENNVIQRREWENWTRSVGRSERDWTVRAGLPADLLYTLDRDWRVKRLYWECWMRSAALVLFISIESLFSACLIVSWTHRGVSNLFPWRENLQSNQNEKI